MSINTLASLVAVAPRVDADARAALAVSLERTRPPGILLVTCHRVELYASAPVVDELRETVPTGGDLLTAEGTATHLVRVALGLESAVIAEDQVLHQLRSAVANARANHPLPPDLDRLADLALAAGRRARSWRSPGARSLADVALDTAVPEGDPAPPEAEGSTGARRAVRLLVVGTGAMGRLAAHAAAARRWDITVAGPTPAHVRALAADVRGVAAPFDPGDALRTFDAVVVALRGPWVLAQSSVDALDGAPSRVVDLSMPRAVPELPRHVASGRVVDVDALATTGPADHDALLRPRLERLAAETIDAFERWRAGSTAREAAAALAARADAERARALARLWSRLPGLDADERAAIEAMTRHLAGDLLREPLSRLTRDHAHEAAARKLFGL